MTKSNANPLNELLENHAQLEKKLWEDLKLRLSGNAPPDHLQQVLAELCDHSNNTDLAAWEPERISNVHFAKDGSLICGDNPEPKLSPEDRDKLAETIRTYTIGSKEISDSAIAAAMLEQCRQENPDRTKELSDFLDTTL